MPHRLWMIGSQLALSLTSGQKFHLPLSHFTLSPPPSVPSVRSCKKPLAQAAVQRYLKRGSRDKERSAQNDEHASESATRADPSECGRAIKPAHGLLISWSPQKSSLGPECDQNPTKMLPKSQMRNF
jgi:hypothetical protein